MNMNQIIEKVTVAKGVIEKAIAEQSTSQSMFDEMLALHKELSRVTTSVLNDFLAKKLDKEGLPTLKKMVESFQTFEVAMFALLKAVSDKALDEAEASIHKACGKLH